MSNKAEAKGDITLDALITALHDASGPLADDALLSRIGQSRRDGVRVLLPHGDMPIAAAPQRRRWGWGVAAAAALVIAPTVWSARASIKAALADAAGRSSPNGVASADPVIGEKRIAAGPPTAQTKPTPPGASPDGLSQLLKPWPQVAYAQSPGVRREAAYAPIGGVNALRLAEGRRSYVRSSASDYHTMLPHEIVETMTLKTGIHGVAAWRVASTSPGWRLMNEHGNTGLWTSDTLWLRATDLRPIERHYRIGGAAVVIQRFTDSTLAEVDSMLPPERSRVASRGVFPTLRRTMQLDTLRIFIHTEAALRLLLRSVALQMGWRGSVSVPSGDSRVMVLGTPQYLNLRVAGVDTVQTFSGRIACWRVLLDTGPKPDVWYVSQETGETILTDGAYGAGYPESQLRLLYGFEETRRISPVRVR